PDPGRGLSCTPARRAFRLLGQRAGTVVGPRCPDEPGRCAAQETAPAVPQEGLADLALWRLAQTRGAPRPLSLFAARPGRRKSAACRLPRHPAPPQLRRAGISAALPQERRGVTSLRAARPK